MSVGCTLDFDVDYKALLMIFMSKYVEKVPVWAGQDFMMAVGMKKPS